MVHNGNVVDVRMVPEICEGCEDMFEFGDGYAGMLCRNNENWHAESVKGRHGIVVGLVPELEYKCRRLAAYQSMLRLREL